MKSVNLIMAGEKINLFHLIPERNIKFEESSDGFVILLKPKFENKWLVKYVLPRLKKPHFRIKLDRLGSFVWQQCDGKNTVEQIANLFKQKFQEDIDPVYDRIAMFIQTLARHRFIVFKDLSSSLNHNGASKEI